MRRTHGNFFFLFLGVLIGAACVYFWRNLDRTLETDGISNVTEYEEDAKSESPSAAQHDKSNELDISDNRSTDAEPAESLPIVQPIGLPDIYEQHIKVPRKFIQFSEIHAVFEAEPRDESWALAMEAGISHSIANSKVSEFILVEYLECRSRMCEMAGHLQNEDVHAKELVSDFERSGAWPGRFSVHESRFGDVVGERFVMIISSYDGEELRSIVNAQ